MFLGEVSNLLFLLHLVQNYRYFYDNFCTFLGILFFFGDSLNARISRGLQRKKTPLDDPQFFARFGHAPGALFVEIGLAASCNTQPHQSRHVERNIPDSLPTFLFTTSSMQKFFIFQFSRKIVLQKSIWKLASTIERVQLCPRACPLCKACQSFTKKRKQNPRISGKAPNLRARGIKMLSAF
jgi:hypothetical protein